LDGSTVRIRLRKGDFEVEVEGERVWAEGKFNELTNEGATATLAQKPETIMQLKAETLGEFLDQKGNPTTHTEVIAVFAYWLFKVEKMESFNARDIGECYSRTRKVKPSNINQIINQNVSTHLLSETSEKKDGLKAWFITRTGEDYVERMGSPAIGGERRS
jgi:hypothetical protein